MIEQLGELASSQWLEKLSLQAIENERLPMLDILKNCCYAPACGFDFDIIDVAAGNVCSFVFIDKDYQSDEVINNLKSSISDRFKVVGTRLIKSPSELTQDRKPAPLTAMQKKRIPKETLTDDSPEKRFAFWAVLEATGSEHLKRISLLIISADAVASYHYLFGAYGVAPALVNITQSQTAKQNKAWSRFFNEDGIFAEFVLRSPHKAFPQYFMFGGFGNSSDYRENCWPYSYGFEVTTLNYNSKNYVVYKKTEDKSLWPFRLLQVLPFDEQNAITTKDIDLRLKKHFKLNLKPAQLLHQLRALEETGLIIQSKENEKQRSGYWYRNKDIAIDISSTNSEGVIGLSILDKIGEKLLPNAYQFIHELVEQQRRRLALITDNDNAEKIASRFAYADFVPTQKIRPEVSEIINSALLNQCAITFLYRPRDEEKLIVDVGIPLGIVQKNSLQTLVVEIKNVRQTETSETKSKIIRVSLDRIQKAHLNRYEGQLDCASNGITAKGDNNFWRNSYDPAAAFDNYIADTAGGMSSADFSNTSEVKAKEIKAHIHVHLKTHLETAPRFTNQVFKKLDNTPYSHDPMHDGNDNIWYELTGGFHNAEEVYHWILSWAERIVVIEPSEVRENIERRMKKTVEHYQRLNI